VILDISLFNLTFFVCFLVQQFGKTKGSTDQLLGGLKRLQILRCVLDTREIQSHGWSALFFIHFLVFIVQLIGYLDNSLKSF